MLVPPTVRFSGSIIVYQEMVWCHFPLRETYICAAEPTISSPRLRHFDRMSLPPRSCLNAMRTTKMVAKECWIRFLNDVSCIITSLSEASITAAEERRSASIHSMNLVVSKSEPALKRVFKQTQPNDGIDVQAKDIALMRWPLSPQQEEQQVDASPTDDSYRLPRVGDISAASASIC